MFYCFSKVEIISIFFYRKFLFISKFEVFKCVIYFFLVLGRELKLNYLKRIFIGREIIYEFSESFFIG